MKIQHYCSVAFIWTEILVIASFTGWTFLTKILKNEGHFSYLCQGYRNSTEKDLPTEWNNGSTAQPHITRSGTAFPTTSTYPTCTEQTEMFNLIYTLTTALISVFIWINGIVSQKLKTRLSRLMGALGYAGGCLFIATSSRTRSEFLFPGMILLAWSTSIFYVTGAQFGNLFPNARYTVVSTLTGFFLSGTTVFWIANFAYEAGITLSRIFYFLTIFSVLSVAGTFTLAPKDFFPNPIPAKFTYGWLTSCKNVAKKECSEDQYSVDTNVSDREVEVLKYNLSLWAMIRKPFFCATVIQITVLNLRNFFFLGTFDSWAASITTDKEQLSWFTNAFGIILLCGGAAAPVTGLVGDTLKQRYRNVCTSEDVVALKALSVTSGLVSILSVLFSALVCIPGLKIQYFSLTLFAIFRTAIYSNLSIAITTYYPLKHFGTLLGIAMFVASTISFVRYPLLSLALRGFDGNFTQVNILLLALCFLSFIHPVYTYRLFCHKLSNENGVREQRVNQTTEGSDNLAFESRTNIDLANLRNSETS